MSRSYKEAKPYDLVRESLDTKLIYECLRTKRSTRLAVEKQVIEIIGPLNAKERWDLLIEAHFPDIVRSKIYTGDQPWAVAYKLVETAISYGYPANAYLLQLVGVENIQVEGFDNSRVLDALSKLYVNEKMAEESIQNTMRRHENHL